MCIGWLFYDLKTIFSPKLFSLMDFQDSGRADAAQPALGAREFHRGVGFQLQPLIIVRAIGVLR